MKTVNLNSVTLKKNGTPVELMGVTDKSAWTKIVDFTVTDEQTSDIVFPFEKPYADIIIFFSVLQTPSATQNFRFYLSTANGYTISRAIGVVPNTSNAKGIFCYSSNDLYTEGTQIASSASSLATFKIYLSDIKNLIDVTEENRKINKLTLSYASGYWTLPIGGKVEIYAR